MTELRVAERKEIPRRFYNNKTVYAYTVSPCNNAQHFKVPENRLESVVERFRSMFLKHLKPVAQYVFIVEVSEPVESRDETGLPRIHFHGVIKFRNCIRYLSEHLEHLMRISSIVISPYDADYWPRYCEKQKDLMAPELGNAYYLSDKDSRVTAHGPTDHVVSPSTGERSEAERIEKRLPVDRGALVAKQPQPRRRAMAAPTIHSNKSSLFMDEERKLFST